MEKLNIIGYVVILVGAVTLSNAGVAYQPYPDYSDRMCRGGFCYCTGPGGMIIQSTKVHRDHMPVSCPDPRKHCTREHQLLPKGVMSIGMHKCAPDGSYILKQCVQKFQDVHECYCVDKETGTKDENSVTPQSPYISFTCPDRRGKCLRAMHKAMDPRIMDQFVPECEDDGIYYKTKQCYGFTDYCWCTDKDTGKTVEGTSMPRSVFDIDCDKPITMCQKARVEVFKNGIVAPDVYVPACGKDGMFVRRQCDKHPFSKTCWCVDPMTGKKEDDSDFSESVPFTCPYTKGKCGRARDKASNPLIMDSFMPECEDDGIRYKTRQCYGFTNVCWCADPDTGIEIEGTNVPSKYADSFNCDQPLPLTSCQMAISKFFKGDPFKIATDLLDCDSNGLYYGRQCPMLSSSCFCVDPVTGKKEEGSDAPKGVNVNCPDTRGKCGKERDEMLDPRLMDAMAIECEDDNIHYKSKQCNGFLGTCYCVDRVTGKPRDRTTLPSDDFAIDCDKEIYECHMKRSDLLGGGPAGTNFIGAPKCTMQGFFQAKQCGIDSCWCVNQLTGEYIQGTDTMDITGKDLTCPEKTYCQLKRESQMNKGLVGAKVPQCTDDGKFKAKQCWGSSGYCVCVNQYTGEEFSETSVFGTQFMHDCTVSPPKAICHVQRDNGIASGAIGAPIPQCTSDGRFMAKQCSGSSGYCVCVNQYTGEEFKDTSAFATQFKFDCSQSPPRVFNGCKVEDFPNGVISGRVVNGYVENYVRLTYTCNPGFQQRGTRRRLCKNNNFVRPQPRCVEYKK